MELSGMVKLIMIPDFDGLLNLERFVLKDCGGLEEIHPSIGRLERLVFLSIKACESLKMSPPITQLKKLETLSFKNCPHLFKSEKEVASYKRCFTNFFVNCWRCGCSNIPSLEYYSEEPSLPHNNLSLHIGLCFILRDLKKMNLSYCRLGDEETDSVVWELPNLITLDLLGNSFSRLNFSLMRVPRLKWLNVSGCKELVELSELPSSIAVVRADYCRSLESFGDISNCKWLWNVSLVGENKVGGDILLDSMLQGNAIEDLFIIIILKNQIPKAFVGSMFRGRTITLHLLDDWYNDFCGFLICVVTNHQHPDINIVMKKEVDEDYLFESNEAVEPECDNNLTTYVGYASFGSLMHTKFSYSSFTAISVSVDPKYGNSFDGETYVGVELVPRKPLLEKE